jgi:hypothetical protein
MLLSVIEIKDNIMSETSLKEHLFMGGWKTNDSSSITAITAYPLEKSKTFHISCTELVDSDFLKFRFYVDGKTIIAPLNEGGSVFIQGKSIFVEQLESSNNFIATWQAVQEEELQFTRAAWVVNPQEGNQSLVASFEDDQEFVISFDRTSPGCSNGKMTVVIDGQTIKDHKNKIITFLEGSSVIGKGKNVSVIVSGTCTKNNKFHGEIKLHKTLNKALKRN